MAELLLVLPLQPDDDHDAYAFRILRTTEDTLTSVLAAALWPILLLSSLGEDMHPSGNAFTRDDPTPRVDSISRGAARLPLRLQLTGLIWRAGNGLGELGGSRLRVVEGRMSEGGRERSRLYGPRFRRPLGWVSAARRGCRPVRG